jgi:RimJ/RimL family protein N-acetyltransferase
LDEKEFEVAGAKFMLKAVSSDDLEWIYGLMTNPRVRERFFSQEQFSREESASYWERKLKEDSFRAFGIWQGSSAVGLIRLDGKDVSIAVKPELWGRGIAFNALKLLDLEGFKARVKVGNEASVKLFKKLGFKESYIVLERD